MEMAINENEMKKYCNTRWLAVIEKDVMACITGAGLL